MYKAGDTNELMQSLDTALSALQDHVQTIRDQISQHIATPAGVGGLTDDLTTTLGLAVRIESELTRPYIPAVEE